MKDNITDAAQLRAGDLAVALADGTSPAELSLDGDDDLFVQVIDANGDVLASTLALEGTQPVAGLDPGEQRTIDGSIVGDDDPFVVVAAGALTHEGEVVVLAGRNLDLVVETVALVRRILFISVPLVLAIVAFITWTVVGRALAPVESIRKEVTDISASELNRRVPEPPGDDEIARLARTMNDMLGRLEESMKRQLTFISDASHELRSPIAAIAHHAEVALAHPEATTLETFASDVLTEDRRLQRIAEDLLLLARADERTLELSSKPLDLDDLVLEEAKRLKLTSPLRVDTSDVSGGRAVGDRSALQRVVRNLADNAAAARRHSGQFRAARTRWERRPHRRRRRRRDRVRLTRPRVREIHASRRRAL